MKWGWWVLAVLAGCDGPDEFTCEIPIDGVTVCVDVNDRKYCERDLLGAATPSEKEPGGPYEYCEDLFDVACPGHLNEYGENYSAELTYYAATDEDCTAADGAEVGEPGGFGADG
jgi:hypothetical protein